MAFDRTRRCGTLASKIIFGWALILSSAGSVVVEWVRQRGTDTDHRGNG